MKLNKKMIIMLASVIGVVVVLIIVIMLFVGGGNKTLSYENIEGKLVSAGERYFENHKDKLPDSGSASVDVNTLVSEGYLNDLSTYTEDGVTCDGKAYVTKNPTGYSYRANLECGKNYSTNTLSSVLKKNIVTSGSGLYEMPQVSSDDNSSSENVYVFKGDNVNNYIKLGDFHWRIVKVYENGEIAVLGDPELLRRLWDNRFNLDTDSYRGINDYKISRMLDYIDSDIIDNDDGYLIIKSLITTHNACIGKRALNDTSRNGSAECSEILENQYFSLLPVYDYMNASLDNNCNIASDDSCYNYNYLAGGVEDWWTITGVKDNSQDVYYVYKTMKADYANQVKSARLYAHFDSNVMYVSGTGTYDDPYIVK